MEERVSKQEEEALMREKEYQSLDQQVKDTQAKFKKLHKKYKARTHTHHTAESMSLLACK